MWNQERAVISAYGALFLRGDSERRLGVSRLTAPPTVCRQKDSTIQLHRKTAGSKEAGA
jgi:hypothetical protein